MHSQHPQIGSSSSSTPVSLSPPNQSIGTADTTANIPSDPDIVPHPNRYSTRPPQSGPKNTPANWHIHCNPNPCATGPFDPRIPGSRLSMAINSCCVSTNIAGAHAWMKRPIRKRRVISRAIFDVSSRSTNRRHISAGDRRVKQTKAIIRVPQ